MPKKGHSEEQILRALHQAESGTTVREVCREHGISDANCGSARRRSVLRRRRYPRRSPLGCFAIL